MNLIERIEGAEEGSRELDAEIIKLVSKGVLAGEYWTLPSYSASLDAAMSLVPDDHWLEIKGPRKYLNIPTPVPNHWSAMLEPWNHERRRMGWAATPALALCAAALRAIGDTHDD